MTRPTADTATEGYAPTAAGVQMYWRSLGNGGTPLVVVHGGFGLADMFGDLIERLAERRRVVAVELQGHGHTRTSTGRSASRRSATTSPPSSSTWASSRPT